MSVIGFKLPEELKELLSLYNINQTLFDDILNEIIILNNARINEYDYDNFKSDCSDFEDSLKYKFSLLSNNEMLYNDVVEFIQRMMFENNLTAEYKFHYIDNNLLVLKKE